MPHRQWRLQRLVVVVGSGSTTSCSRCVGGGSLLSVIKQVVQRYRTPVYSYINL